MICTFLPNITSVAVDVTQSEGDTQLHLWEKVLAKISQSNVDSRLGGTKGKHQHAVRELSGVGLLISASAYRVCFVTGPNMTQPAVGSSISRLGSFIGEDGSSSDVDVCLACPGPNIGQLTILVLGGEEPEVVYGEAPRGDENKNSGRLAHMPVSRRSSGGCGPAYIFFFFEKNRVVPVMPMMIVGVHKGIQDKDTILISAGKVLISRLIEREDALYCQRFSRL